MTQHNLNIECHVNTLQTASKTRMSEPIELNESIGDDAGSFPKKHNRRHGDT